MARAFSVGPSKPSTESWIATGEQYDSRGVSDYTDILQRARTDGEKHTGVRDLCASLAGSGVPVAMAEAIVRNACPVWDEGVEKLLSTAYEKFFTVNEVTPVDPDAIDPFDFPFWNPIDLSKIPHPKFVYSDFYARGYTSLTRAAPKVGKSML